MQYLEENTPFLGLYRDLMKRHLNTNWQYSGLVEQVLIMVAG
jgi:hypothetical protein